jgi:hypothetical protein
VALRLVAGTVDVALGVSVCVGSGVSVEVGSGVSVAVDVLVSVNVGGAFVADARGVGVCQAVCSGQRNDQYDVGLAAA